jgi:hypothetical protein
MFPNRNIHKYTWTSPYGKTHNRLDHVLINKRWHSNTVDRFSRGTDCDTDYYLMVAKVRQILSISKRTVQKFDMERFTLKNLDDVVVKEKNQVRISNRYVVLETWRTMVWT